VPRSMSSDMLAAVVAQQLRPALFVEAVFATSTLYVWSGLGSKTWNGHTWEGVGSLLGVTGISEDSSVEAKNVTLSLSGIPAEVLGDVLSELRITQAANVWLACFHADGTMVADPVLAYAGCIDKPTIDDGADTCTVSIQLENVLVDLNRPVWRRYTDADQKLDHPTDTGFQYVQGIQQITVYWGSVPGAYNQ